MRGLVEMELKEAVNRGGWFKSGFGSEDGGWILVGLELGISVDGAFGCEWW